MDAVYASLPVKEPGTIRVLEIETGSFEADIVIALKCASLDDPDVYYEALSYTWGDPHDTEPVLCNDVRCHVTRNLFSALRRLRENKRVRIWADALCINQMDNDERAAQVKQMLRIYKQAKTVWMHMGAESDVIDENRLYSLMYSLDQALNRFAMDDTTTIHPSQFAELGLPPVEDEAWKLWQKMLSNPYFTRLWVIQEFAVSKPLFIMYGTKYFPWWNLSSLSDRMQQHGIGEESRPMSDSKLTLGAINGKNGLINLYKCHYSYQEGIALKIEFLLWQARFVKCTDPKDKVFGLLGVAGNIDHDDPDFEIKYDDNESVSELFTRTARGVIRTKKSLALELLYEGGRALNERLENLPSWIPDWTSNRAGSPLGGLAESAGYHAADALELHAEMDGRALHVRGRIVDRIDRLSSEFRPDTTGEHSNVYYGLAVSKWLRKAFDLVLSIWPDGIPSNGNSAVKETLWKTLICNKTHNDGPAPAEYSTTFDAMLVRQQFVDDALVGIEDEDKLEIPDPTGAYTSADAGSMNYRLALQNTMYTKKFCVTKERSMMGMVPGSAEVGDYVVVIAGSTVPFILRKATPAKGSTSEWNLIQECYIHGVMDGEFGTEVEAEWERLVLI